MNRTHSESKNKKNCSISLLSNMAITAENRFSCRRECAFSPRPIIHSEEKDDREF
jgi:hypothetical protein